MKVEDLNNAKIPIIKINKKLERFRGKVLFPEKLEMAFTLLSKVVLPKLPSWEINLVFENNTICENPCYLRKPSTQETPSARCRINWT